ncbi:MAG: O-antigen ligase family protein [Bacteroidota bacterium]|nr:O-antigen ligase family protein [Bacteroidota bacterium]
MQYYLTGRLSQHLLWLACLAGVAGLLASRALVALSPAVGLLAALANPNIRRALPNYWRNRTALCAAAQPVFLVLSAIYTTEWGTWRHELFRMLPWLAVPLAFTLAVPLTGRQRRTVGALFALGTVAVGLATLGSLLRNPAGAIAAIRVGQNPAAITGVFHITFGVMLALACFVALKLGRRPRLGRSQQLLWMLTAGAAAVVLHALAYRTGLLAFYAVLLGIGAKQLAGGRWPLAAGLALALVAGPLAAFYTLESVRTQVGITLWDVAQYREGRDLNNHSLGQRLAAIETAAVIIRQHWLIGVAPADVQAAMRAQYEWQSFGLRPENRAEVHNQYLVALLGGGVPGLALWLALLFVPLAHPRLRRNSLVFCFITIQVATNLVDAALELQTGLNLFIFGYGFLIVAGERYWQAPQHIDNAPPTQLLVVLPGG